MSHDEGLMHEVAVRCLGGILLASVAGTMSAQNARIIGHTHGLGDTTRSVPGVEVTLIPSWRTVRSDSAGVFVFTAVADGAYHLRGRRLGFALQALDIDIIGQDDRIVQLPMRLAPQTLAEVTISGRRVMVPARYADAYARVGRANGDFFTHEKIDSLQALDMKALLQRLPGVYVNERGIIFRRCEASPMVPFSKPSRENEDGGGTPWAARVQVYVDGVRVTGYGGGSAEDAAHALRDIRPSSLELVEVYRGVARIPGEYLADACAVILVWTK